jgi:hypothetical protein
VRGRPDDVDGNRRRRAEALEVGPPLPPERFATAGIEHRREPRVRAQDGSLERLARLARAKEALRLFDHDYPLKAAGSGTLRIYGDPLMPEMMINPVRLVKLST